MTRELAARPTGPRAQGDWSISRPEGFTNILHRAARRLERLEVLDKVAKPPAGAVGRAVRPRVVRNLLSGTGLGHPLHLMLTRSPAE